MTRLPDSSDTPNDDAPNAAVRRIGPYRLMRRVAEGGMSSVYQAYDDESQRTVAVKVLSDSLSTKPEFVRRFRREARWSQMLRHEHIVRGLTSGYDRPTGKHYLAMDFIAGPTAAAILAESKRLPISLVARIGIDIASALSFLHGVHFVHRDVKPENILLHPHGSAKLADLGLVRKIDGASDLTASNQGIGTPYYMPHEQAQNSSLVDGRSDLFSLGATLYHLATGELPFPGETHEAIALGKESGAFRPARSVWGDVPHDLDLILSKMLDRNIRQRYQNAADVVADLKKTGAAASPKQFAAFIESGTTSAETGSAHPLTATRTDLPAGKLPLRQNHGPRAVAVIGLAALCGFAAWMSQGQPNDGANPCDEWDQTAADGTVCGPDAEFSTDRRQVLTASPSVPYKS